MQDTNPARPRVIIVGGGFAGLKAARALKKVPADILVLDRNNHHLFQPLLYQVATAGLSPADIASPIRSVLRDQKNTEVLMGEVIGVDRKLKQVILNKGKFSYDYLVLATGSRHSYFGHDEWERYAPGLKSVEDATVIRQKILLAFEAAEFETQSEKQKQLLTFILVGGGPTGVEMAGSIAELAQAALASDFRHINPKHSRVILLEAGERILSSFSEDLSKKAETSLKALGVEVRTRTRVENIDQEGVLISGQRIASKTIVWAAGVRASPVGKWLGVETDRSGRVKVEPDLSISGDPCIFVIGDCATLQDENGNPLPGVAPVAMQEGKYVAQVIQKRIGNKKPIPPFRYVNKGNLATIGRSSAIADLGTFKLSGFIAWMAWLLVHIFYLIGFRNRILVMIQWAWAYFTFQRGARLITFVGRSTLNKAP